MKKMLMISNMYPNQKHPHYGSFVKNTYNLINSREKIRIKKIILYKYNNRIIKFFAYVIWFFKIISIGILGNYDCIYAHYISHSAFPICIVKKIRKNIIVIENAHGEDVLAEEKRYEKNIKRSARVLKVTDLVIVPSKYYCDVIHTSFQIPYQNLFVYPSGGINRKIFYPMNKKKSKDLFQRTEEFVVGFVARIENNKGWRDFLDAVTILKEKNDDIGMIIVGSGSEDVLLQREIVKRRLTESCTLCQTLNQQDLVYAYNAMDVICCCSKRRSESLGLVGLEAMASGCECILSSAPGHLTYAQEGYNAHIFEESSIEKLVEKINQVREEPKEVKSEIVKNGLKTAAQYDSEKVTDDLMDKISSILKL